MSKTIRTFLNVLVCVFLCASAVWAAGDETKPAFIDLSGLTKPTEQTTPTENSKEEPKQENNPQINKQTNETALISITQHTDQDEVFTPETKADAPETNRTVQQVVSIVGDNVEIINIDGLEVPLADGSMFYIPFVDVAADAYYTEAVAWAYANDITAGVTELSFGPNQTCTRAQMVTFLWRAAGCLEPSKAASGFSDVAAGSWYEKAVAWAVENRITAGVGGGRFDPNGIVNRAQAVTFLYRAKGSPAVASDNSFTDVKSGEFYADAVAWAVANNVTNGVGDNSFAPSGNCVRGQTVTFLYRAYK